MKTTRIRNISLIALIFLIFSVSACKKNNTDENTPAALTGVQLTANAKFGNIITDNAGRSIYFFAIDANGTSGCTGGCLLTWPIFYKENPSVGTGLNAADFGVITRADGAKQTTYKGWPLYYYASDSAAGDTKGDGIGQTWFVAKNDYTVLVAKMQLTGHDGLQYTSQGVAGQESSTFLTDVNGRTLYMFSRDTHNTNTFTKADLSNDAVWPMYQVDPNIGSIPSTFAKSDFSTISVAGKTQLVYKGHPLYYFGQDAALRGNTKGVSFPTPGAAVWKIVNTATPVL